MFVTTRTHDSRPKRDIVKLNPGPKKNYESPKYGQAIEVFWNSLHVQKQAS
jgi:hypothetical protein